MKTVAESMGLRNALLSNFERAVTCFTEQEKQDLLNIVIVGGGPTGVELAGAIAEMKKYVLPKDYPDMDSERMNIYLVQSSDRLLPSMSAKASKKSLAFLEKLGVEVILNTRVTDYKDNVAILNNGRTIRTRTFMWVCGIIGNKIIGLKDNQFGPGGRVLVDEYNKVIGTDNIFAIGDIALMLDKDKKFPKGHPQMAQPSIQQGKNLADNLKAMLNNKPLKPFKYKDLGSMATIGRNKAVADVFGMRFAGMFAWMLWMVVHLRSILGIKNKLSVLFDWSWSYVTYDKSNRMILTAAKPKILREREMQEQLKHWGELENMQEMQHIKSRTE